MGGPVSLRMKSAKIHNANSRILIIDAADLESHVFLRAASAETASFSSAVHPLIISCSSICPGIIR